MRAPDLIRDGWCLEDGEQRHRDAPTTFEIPDLEVRQSLEPGDFAQLIFKIAIENDEEPESVERMWVVMSARTDDGYLGILNNEPATISENTDFWLGIELPFEPRHIISVQHANPESMAIANSPPSIPWDRA
jgi:hypothetical protein